MTFLRKQPGDQEPLGPKQDVGGKGSLRCPVHVFDKPTIDAINAALAAQRPLLVCGEPGIGKTQLARAVARALGRAYVHHVVDVRTESRDLLWHFDAVKRLADAQLGSALNPKGNDSAGLSEMRESLAVKHYLQPRALWWGFDWAGAEKQSEIAGGTIPPQIDGGDPANGCVVLIDEIDKGESDVPNGLLEALGAGEFTPDGWGRPVVASGTHPLVIITTNEERSLPDAFVRRCLVLSMALPQLPKNSARFKSILDERGKAHFPASNEAVRQKAAKILVTDRQEAIKNDRRPLPGQAEYLDLLRAVQSLHEGADEQLDALDRVADFAVRKSLGSGA